MGVTTILSTKLTGYSMTKLTMFGFRCRVLRRMIPQVIVLSTLVLRSLSRRKARPVEAGSREWRKVEKMILKDNRYEVDDDTFEAEKLNRNHRGRATVTIVSVKRCKAYNEGNWSSVTGYCSSCEVEGSKRDHQPGQGHSWSFGDIVENMLHGTDIHAAKSISEKGFDISYNNRHVFGKVHYAGDNFNFCHNYAKAYTTGWFGETRHTMLICDLAMGRKGDYLEDEGTDSVVKDTCPLGSQQNYGTTMYAVNEDRRITPKYLVEYTIEYNGWSDWFWSFF